ncbi:hypothetical protein [Halomicrococcus sp. NG-SE-24]|uniref:hypothetical protein n=1 Tax=Halomicrococcus sp. NG-SE-24 TaxID=3436928 RepID=UPI003D97CA4D
MAGERRQSGTGERLAGLVIWLLAVAATAVALDLLGLLAVPVGTATWLLALGGVLTVLVESFLRYFSVGRLF